MEIAGRERRVVPGELIVKLRAPQATPAACVDCRQALEAIFDRHGVRGGRPLFTPDAPSTRPASGTRFAARTRRAPAGARLPDLGGTYLLRLAAGTSVAQAVHELSRHPAVEYAEPNVILQAQWVPDDPYLLTSGAWGQTFGDLWGLARIDMTAAWDLSRGRRADGQPIVVAVVDSGVDATHADLAANLWRNADEVPDNGIDDDHNGYVDDVQGWDFVSCDAFAGCSCGEPKSPDALPEDSHGHGTHVAGTIAAVGDNGYGIVGVAPGAVVMPLRALNRFGEGSTAELAEALHYAVENGADVINASWGGIGTSRTLADVVADAHAHGVVVVAAAGNAHGRDVLRFTPASLPEVITVAASNPADDPFDFASGFSCRGARLDLAAPGIDVLSLRAAGTDLYHDGEHVVDEEFLRASGTSMAAPHVAGVVAGLLAARPELTVDEIRQLLRASPVDIGAAGWDVRSGFGRLDAPAALTRTAGPTAALTSPAMGELLLDRSLLELQGTAAGPGFDSYRIRARRIDQQEWTTVVPETAMPVTGGPLGDWDLASLGDGVYHLELSATNEQGGTAFDLREAVVFHDGAVKSGWPRRVEDVLSGGSPVVGDLDRDGKDEIVVSGIASLAAYRADGTLLWRRAYDGFISGASLGDLDGDGRLELVLEELSCAGARLHVLGHDGSPRWTRTVPITTGSRAFPPLAVTLGDVDRNGTLEILVPHPNDKLFVYSRGGALMQAVPGPANGGAVVFGDLDRDGAPEVVFDTVLPTGGRYLHKLVYRKKSRRLVAAPGWPVQITAPDGYDSIGLSFRGPIAVDLDGDRRREVVLAAGGELHALRANGKPLRGWPRTLPRRDDIGLLAAGDLDGDRRPEIVLGTWASGILVVRANGRITPVAVPFGDAFETSPVIADLDGDGRSELVIKATRFTFHGDTDGLAHVIAVGYRPASKTFETLWTKNVTLVSGFEDIVFASPVLGDFDRNGRLDLFVASPLYNGSHYMVWELPASPPRAAAWPMYGHDARHTNSY